VRHIHTGSGRSLSQRHSTKEPIMFHNILVAVDGSPDAEQALTQAIDLADSEHTRLTLITGIQQLPRSPTPDSARRRWPRSTPAPDHGRKQCYSARDRVPDDLPVTTILTDRPADPRRAHRPNQPRPARPRRDGLTRPRRDPRRPPRQRQPLHPQSQPHARSDCPHPPDLEARRPNHATQPHPITNASRRIATPKNELARQHPPG
jgi:hypothetical protein